MPKGQANKHDCFCFRIVISVILVNNEKFTTGY